MKGGFTKLFGKVPRVAVIEAFAQNSGHKLTATEVREIAGVSKRSTYLIIGKFIEDGLIIAFDSKPKRFLLNLNDARGKTLAIAEPLLELGSLESFLKEEEEIPQETVLSGGILDQEIP